MLFLSAFPFGLAASPRGPPRKIVPASLSPFEPLPCPISSRTPRGSGGIVLSERAQGKRLVASQGSCALGTVLGRCSVWLLGGVLLCLSGNAGFAPTHHGRCDRRTPGRCARRSDQRPEEETSAQPHNPA